MKRIKDSSQSGDINIYTVASDRIGCFIYIYILSLDLNHSSEEWLNREQQIVTFAGKSIRAF